MTIEPRERPGAGDEPRVRCLGCGKDLGEDRDGAATLAERPMNPPPICRQCALQDEVLAHLSTAWRAERRVRFRDGLRVDLDATEELLVLTGLETLDAIEALLPQGAGDRVAGPLAIFRGTFRACGPYSRALAAAVRVNADATVRALLACGSPAAQAEIERLRARLVRTEQALADAENRAAMSARLADERFRRFAEDVQSPQPN